MIFRYWANGWSGSICFFLDFEISFTPIKAFFYIHKNVLKSKNFRILFIMDLHVFGWPEYDLNFFCTDVCLSVCLLFFGHCTLKLMHGILHNFIFYWHEICWLDFGVYCAIVAIALPYFFTVGSIIVFRHLCFEIGTNLV